MVNSMVGKAKRKYNGENIRIAKSLRQPVLSLWEALPAEYDGKVLLEWFKRYYPREWGMIAERYDLHRKKDEFLKSVGKKRRYHPQKPEDTFFHYKSLRISYLQRKKKSTKSFIIRKQLRNL